MMKNHGQQYYSQVGLGCGNVLDVHPASFYSFVAELRDNIRKKYKCLYGGSEVSLDFGGHTMLNFTVICMSVQA